MKQIIQFSDKFYLIKNAKSEFWVDCCKKCSLRNTNECLSGAGNICENEKIYFEELEVRIK